MKVSIGEGAPIYRCVDDYEQDNPLKINGLFLEGMRVLVAGIDGYRWATIRKDRYNKWYAEDEGSIFSLKLGKEHWVCTSQISKSCIDVIKRICMKNLEESRNE